MLEFLFGTSCGPEHGTPRRCETLEGTPPEGAWQHHSPKLDYERQHPLRDVMSFD